MYTTVIAVAAVRRSNGKGIVLLHVPDLEDLKYETSETSMTTLRSIFGQLAKPAAPGEARTLKALLHLPAVGDGASPQSAPTSGQQAVGVSCIFCRGYRRLRRSPFDFDALHASCNKDTQA